MRLQIGATILCLAFFSCWDFALAEETIVSTVDLPGASLEQEITYSTSRADYESARDKTLERMKNADNTAFVNPKDGPWMRVETTAEIGLSIKGVGTSEGRKYLRQISAAEEALFLYEKWKKGE